jgi:hypothetical protein
LIHVAVADMRAATTKNSYVACRNVGAGGSPTVANNILLQQSNLEELLLANFGIDVLDNVTLLHLKKLVFRGLAGSKPIDSITNIGFQH